MTDSCIQQERHGKVSLISLSSRNPLNPLTDELIDGLVEALSINEADPDIHASVITGSDKAFAAGADIVGMSKLGLRHGVRAGLHRAQLGCLAYLAQAAGCRRGGYALGGGCELAMKAMW
ncbi:hypothetical protein CEJ98_21110 [Burkholderia gladioli pv. gladioli]|nr:hypothetical protein CEJ98_21110 [Burkholderia gladioli pv. gladioli]